MYVSDSDPPSCQTFFSPFNLCSTALVQIQRKQAIHASRARPYQVGLTKTMKGIRIESVDKKVIEIMDIDIESVLDGREVKARGCR